MKKISLRSLEKMSDERLLSARLCELDIKIEGTWIESCVQRLYKELSDKGIDLHVSCYLADEWLCPDGEPAIGIAFFIAHPRLRKLEHKMMLEVEGGTKEECIKLLRHEMGHAINYAYLLHKRKLWKRHFGEFSAEYGDRYKYRPYSRSFVRHLGEWYAQYHPDEDFAETFAVWLDPESNWKEEYKGWKALEKLRYVDHLMEEVSKKSPKKPRGEQFWDVSKLKTTLRTYYKKKQRLYAEQYPDFHDYPLMKIFPDNPEAKGARKTYKLIQGRRKELVDQVALWTGEKKYRINDLLKDLIARSKELGIKTDADESDVAVKTAIYVTAQIMNYLYTGRYKGKNEKIKSSRLI
ncbi:MAG: hypothetical protein P9L88_03005 [Candidatus Tantalella remota]|nr:hypothetical protein [Candidatus Tantalella remota]